MRDVLKVEGVPGLVRDTKTNAIINTDSVEYQRHLKLKEMALSKNQRLDNLENDVAEIKSLLLQLLKEK